MRRRCLSQCQLCSLRVPLGGWACWTLGMSPPLPRTFAPLWEVFRVSSDKLALCHLELTRKLQDLIKDVLRYSEEQLKMHKKVCASRHCPGRWVGVTSGQKDASSFQPLTCVSENSVTSTTSNPDSHKPKHFAGQIVDSQNSRPGAANYGLHARSSPPPVLVQLAS